MQAGLESVQRELVAPEGYRWIRLLLRHRRLVGSYLGDVIQMLFARAQIHDDSKFGPDEFEPYAASLERFEQVAYGSPAYQECLEAIDPAIQHHFAFNRHHPEHYPNGINDMDLVDIIEMLCDWIAACQRTNTVPILRLDLQRERFGIEPQLYGLLCRTAGVLLATTPIEIME